MARLSLPDRYKEPLKQLIALDEDDVAQLRDALSNAQPAQNYQALAARLASSTEQPSEFILDLVGLLVSLARSAYSVGTNLEEAASDAVSSALDAKLVSRDEASALKDRLSGLLTTKAISVSAKAAWLATEQRHVFVDCNVFTDIRPVFSSANGERDLRAHSAVVVHNLEIEYHHGREHLTEFFALDGKDLRTLQAAIERAISKEEELRKVIEKAGMQYIPVE
jgi:hypothetical protein